MSRAGLLLAQMDEVYDRLRGRLEGLTDDEYFWEPVPGCWSVTATSPAPG
jgi:DinB superfamily